MHIVATSIRHSRRELSSFVAQELDRMASMQLPSGALPMKPLVPGKSVRICPYFSSFVALAFLCDPVRYGEYVRRYMEWQFSHLNSAAEDRNGLDGTIYDYTVKECGGQMLETPMRDDRNRPFYDSTDSYGALFLMVLEKYVSKTGDRAYLLDHAADIRRVASAMIGTMDNGLTFARPDYRVKYTMDNCELAWGLSGMLRLGEWIPDVDTSFFENELTQLKRMMEQNLWNGKKGYYEVGLDDNGLSVVPHFNWFQFYPDAMAQAFPLLGEILDPDSERAKGLYRELTRCYPPLVVYSDMPHNAAFLALIAAEMGDIETADQYLAVHQEVFCQVGEAGSDNCQIHALGVLAAASIRLQTAQ